MMGILFNNTEEMFCELKWVELEHTINETFKISAEPVT